MSGIDPWPKPESITIDKDAWEKIQAEKEKERWDYILSLPPGRFGGNPTKIRINFQHGHGGPILEIEQEDNHGNLGIQPFGVGLMADFMLRAEEFCAAWWENDRKKR